MNIKTIFTNLLLTFIATYFPLLVFSGFSFYADKSKRIVNKRVINEDLPKIKEALDSGKSQNITPSVLFNHRMRIGKYPYPEIYPLAALPLTPTFYCNEGYGLITSTTDRFGFRNKDTKWNGMKRKQNIFVLGDSFVQGACVPDDKTITGNLEKSSKINSINLGSGGNTPYEYMAIIKSIIKPIISNSNKDNLVIIIFYQNDNIPDDPKKEKLLSSTNSIIKDLSSKDIYPLETYTKYINNFIKVNYKESKEEIINEFQKFNKYYYITTLVPVRRKLKRIISTNKSSIPPKTSSEESIKLLRKVCKNNCKPIIAYIPNSNFWDPNPNSFNYKKHLRNISKKMQIPFIDGSKVLNKNNLLDYAPKGPHLSIEGYRKISDLIGSEIKKTKHN